MLSNVESGIAPLGFGSGIMRGVPSPGPAPSAVAQATPVATQADVGESQKTLKGASPVGNAPPPPIDRPLNGYGRFTFGMTADEAIAVDSSLSPDSDGTLSESIIVDGIQSTEFLSFSSTAVGRLNDVTLVPTEGGSDQKVFDALTKTYGPSRTVDYENTWTFSNGSTIVESPGEVAYLAPPTALQKQGF